MAPHPEKLIETHLVIPKIRRRRLGARWLPLLSMDVLLGIPPVEVAHPRGQGGRALHDNECDLVSGYDVNRY